MKKYLLVSILASLTVFCFSQQNEIALYHSNGMDEQPFEKVIRSYENFESKKFINLEIDNSHIKNEILFTRNLPKVSLNKSEVDLYNIKSHLNSNIFDTKKQFIDKKVFRYKTNNFDFAQQRIMNKNLTPMNENFFERNRRNIYSSMWAYASLNYLYCDIVAFMDNDLHSQYHTGTVDGMEITPEFLTVAAVMMQISIANVFLPQVIKNDRTLRWVQIASGITMSLIQSATLFAGKPTPYYATFSALEIGATTFITINALRWKTNLKKELPTEVY